LRCADIVTGHIFLGGQIHQAIDLHHDHLNLALLPASATNEYVPVQACDNNPVFLLQPEQRSFRHYG
jgi:hypothetical protein